MRYCVVYSYAQLVMANIHTHLYDCVHTNIRDLSEERELLDDSIGENHRLSRKLGRIERTLDRMDHDKHKVSFMQYQHVHNLGVLMGCCL